MAQKRICRPTSAKGLLSWYKRYFKKYRNKLTSSIRTSKANYFSEAIKSGNNVGELWKHLKDINSVSKCHIKCI